VTSQDRSWHIVAIAVVANMVVTGSTYSAFGLFVLPVSAEYHLSRADMNTAMILLNVGIALLSPVLGRLLDRFAPSRIMFLCAAVYAASFTGLALMRSVPASAAVLAVPLALAVQGCGALTTSVLIARSFTAQRGRAMALSVMGMSFGSILVVPSIGFAIERLGWRGALLAIGVVGGALLAVLSLLARPPRSAVFQTGSSKAAPAQQPLRVAVFLRLPQFWIIALSCALSFAIAQTLVVTLVPLVRQEGLTMAQATGLVSILGGASIGAKLMLAIVADKVDRVLLLSIVFLLGAALNLGLLVGTDYIALVCCAILLGTLVGCTTPAVYALLADRFGAASFGTVRGLTAPITGVMSAVGVRIAGEVFDRTGTYDVLFICFIAIQILAAMMMFAVRFTAPLTTAGQTSRADRADTLEQPTEGARAAR
jgi:MFS family permease